MLTCKSFCFVNLVSLLLSHSGENMKNTCEHTKLTDKDWFNASLSCYSEAQQRKNACPVNAIIPHKLARTSIYLSVLSLSPANGQATPLTTD